jgi:hypothetical protein
MVLRKVSKFLLLLTLIFLSMSLVLGEESRPLIDEYQKENIYVFSSVQDIDATINGDLFLITAESNIQGTINKDLNAISAKLNVQGIIGDDLRIIASEADINVYVFNELKIIADTLKIRETTIINGKSSIKASRANISGVFKDDLFIESKNLDLNIVAEGNVVIEGNKITINPDTKIRGNLDVPEGVVVPNNTVSGKITHVEKIAKVKSSKELLLGKITWFLVLVILSAFIHLVIGNKTDTLFMKTTQRPFLALLLGIIAMILLPIIALLLLASIIVLPVGVLILLGVIALLILAPALGVLFLGKQILEMIRPRREIRLEIIIGSLILVVLSFIPGFMFLAIVLFYALFLGTIILLLWSRRKRSKSKTKTKNVKSVTLKTKKKAKKR